MPRNVRAKSAPRKRSRLCGRRPSKSRHLGYKRHKRTNRGFIQYPRQADGRRPQETFPGEYNSPESKAAYEKSLGYFMMYGELPPWMSRGRSQQPVTEPEHAPACTVTQLCEQFEKVKLPEYSYSEECLYRVAIKRLILRMGDYRVDDVGKRDLREVRELFIKAGNCRKTINGQVTRIRAIFQWGADEELVPDEVPAKLQALRPLKRGQAHDNEPVTAVPWNVVEATIAHLPQEAGDIIKVLYHCGARSGELYQMRVGDIKKKAGDVWKYDVREHKTARFGHVRSVGFGPRCIEILTRLIDGRKETDLVFVRPQPTDYRNRNRQTGGKAWTRDALGKRIARVCEQHNIPHWHIHQLRHAAGTKVYNQPGSTLAAAQAFLGHHRPSTTEIYIRPEGDLAEDLARKFA